MRSNKPPRLKDRPPRHRFKDKQGPRNHRHKYKGKPPRQRDSQRKGKRLLHKLKTGRSRRHRRPKVDRLRQQVNNGIGNGL